MPISPLDDLRVERQEAGDTLRVTIISPGYTRTNVADAVTSPEMKAQFTESRDRFAMPPEAIAALLRSRSSSRPILT